MENGKKYTNKHQSTQRMFCFISLKVYIQQIKKLNSPYPVFKYFTRIFYSFPKTVVKYVHIALTSVFFLYFITHSRNLLIRKLVIRRLFSRIAKYPDRLGT